MFSKFKKPELTIAHLIYFSYEVAKINIAVCIIYGIYFNYHIQLEIFSFSSTKQKRRELNI